MSDPGGPISAGEVLSRAQWWTTHPPPDGYDQNGTAPDPDGRQYREDCSGFVSMCWHLTDAPNTSGIAAGVANLITKAQLQPGDVLLAVAGVEQFGHVAIFDHWTSPAQTAYVGHEFGHGASPLHHVIPYPYFPNDLRTFRPYHYPNLIPGGAQTSSTGGTDPFADPTIAGSGLGDATTDSTGADLPAIRTLPGVAVIPNRGVSGVDASNRLAQVKIAGQTWTAKVTNRVLSASMSYSVTQVGQLTMSIQDDPDAKLFRSGLFNLGTSIDFADQHMDLRSLTTPNTGGAPRVDIACRSRVISRLKGPTQSGAGPGHPDQGGTWGIVDVSEWVKARAREVGARAVVQPLAQKFPISRQTADTPESTWDVMQRLATELGVWCYEYDQTIVFAKPSWLVLQPTRQLWSIRWASQTSYSTNMTGMPTYTNTYDGSGQATLTFNLIGGQANQIRPGHIVDYDGPGAAGGPWICSSVTIPVVRGVAIAVSCSRANDPLPSVAA